MSIITVYNGIFCNQDSIIETLLSRTGYQLMIDANIIAKAAKPFRSGRRVKLPGPFPERRRSSILSPMKRKGPWPT